MSLANSCKCSFRQWICQASVMPPTSRLVRRRVIWVLRLTTWYDCIIQQRRLHLTVTQHSWICQCLQRSTFCTWSVELPCVKNTWLVVYQDIFRYISFFCVYKYRNHKQSLDLFSNFQNVYMFFQCTSYIYIHSISLIIASSV